MPSADKHFHGADEVNIVREINPLIVLVHRLSDGQFYRVKKSALTKDAPK